MRDFITSCVSTAPQTAEAFLSAAHFIPEQAVTGTLPNQWILNILY